MGLFIAWVVISYKYMVTFNAILTVSIVLGCIGSQSMSWHSYRLKWGQWGSLGGQPQLVVKGRFAPKSLEGILRDA